MSSMLSKFNIKLADLQPYLQVYRLVQPEPLEEWAAQQSAQLMPGALVFSLEQVTQPSGLTLGKKDDVADGYRVKDLAIVVGNDNGRLLVINITQTNFELRYLEVLFFEKAKKALIDDAEYCFVAARPSRSISDEKLSEIEQLGAQYAQGGFRRSLLGDANNSKEPAFVLLSTLGAQLNIAAIGRQPIDIGSIAHMLFTTEVVQDDRNKQIIKACFTPIEAGGQAKQSMPERLDNEGPDFSDKNVENSVASLWQEPLPPGNMALPPGAGDLLSVPAAENTQAAGDEFQTGGFAVENSNMPSELNREDQGQAHAQNLPQTYESPAHSFFDFQNVSSHMEDTQEKSTWAIPPDLVARSQESPWAPPPDLSTKAEDSPWAPPPDLSTKAEESPWAPLSDLSTKAEESPWAPPSDLSTKAEESPWAPPSDLSTKAEESPWAPPSDLSTKAEESPWAPPPDLSTKAEERPWAPPSDLSIKAEESPWAPPPDLSTKAEESPWAPPSDLSTKAEESSWAPPPDLSTKAEESPWAPPPDLSTKAEESPWAPPPDLSTKAEESPWAPQPDLATRSQDNPWMPPPNPSAKSEESKSEAPTNEPEVLPQRSQLFARLYQHLSKTSSELISLPWQQKKNEPEFPIPTDETVAYQGETRTQESTAFSLDSLSTEITKQKDTALDIKTASAGADQTIEATPQEPTAFSFDSVPVPVAKPIDLLSATTEIDAASSVEERQGELQQQNAFSSLSESDTIHGASAGASVFSSYWEGAPVRSGNSNIFPDHTPSIDQNPPATAVHISAYQEPEEQAVLPDQRLVMNEMVTLMGKLELQVARAAKELGSRGEEIKQRLNNEVDSLVQSAAVAGEQSQDELSELVDRLNKDLNNELEATCKQIMQASVVGRAGIEQVRDDKQHQMDESESMLFASLKAECDKFRQDCELIRKKPEDELNQLAIKGIDDLNQLIDQIGEHIDRIGDDFLSKLDQRFARFKERMDDEATSVSSSLQRNVHSMHEEIDGSLSRAKEKLKATQNEFEQSIAHAVRSKALAISQKVHKTLIESLTPQLQERFKRFQKMSESLMKQFLDHSQALSNAQLSRLEGNLSKARKQIEAQIYECTSNLESAGRSQQSSLDELFSEANSHMENLISQAQTKLKNAHAKIYDSESACRRLAETSSIDADNELTEERNETKLSVQRAKQEANTKVHGTVEKSCSGLEQLSQKIQADLTSERMQQTQVVREAAESGLARIREAIQEALNAIHAAREEHMQ